MAKQTVISNKPSIQTNPNFWDCECKENYIKQKRQVYCGGCNTARAGQPDTRQIEIDSLAST
jgi:Zn finger protein HypA/HybF involved in hydrogenase expression